ncbi:hypothetical protein NE865_09704 [Phthorimaea operculella]|nr:hypothetical protein NE865_09704 [Phthorimaea operculella]
MLWLSFIGASRWHIFGRTEADRNWLESLTALTLACSPAPSWYLRRTSWRQSPSLMGLRTLRTSIHLGNRPIFVLKMWD